MYMQWFPNYPIQRYLKQYQLACSALHEEGKFLKDNTGHKCSSVIEVLRQKLVRSTYINSEIKSNIANEHEVLTTVLSVIQKVHPKHLES